MIRETHVDRILNRLSSHFGDRLVVRPPASAAELAGLEAMVGPLPRELTILLLTCDGLRVEADGPKAELHLWHVHEMEHAMCNPPGPAIAPGLVPIRGDLPGACDYVVAAPGPADGAVIRWDAWVPGASVLASNVGEYLESWTEFLIAHFDGNGRKLGDEAALFDASFAFRRDSGVRDLAPRADIQAWLRQMDQCVASGADFE